MSHSLAAVLAAVQSSVAEWRLRGLWIDESDWGMKLRGGGGAWEHEAGRGMKLFAAHTAALQTSQTELSAMAASLRGSIAEIGRPRAEDEAAVHPSSLHAALRTMGAYTEVNLNLRSPHPTPPHPFVRCACAYYY